MADIPFQNTKMGQQFFCKTMPDIEKQLTRIANAMEKKETEPDTNTTVPCKCCCGGKVLWANTHDASLYINTNEKGTHTLMIECDPCPDKAVCGLHHVPLRFVIPINFCPNCGRKLK